MYYSLQLVLGTRYSDVGLWWRLLLPLGFLRGRQKGPVGHGHRGILTRALLRQEMPVRGKEFSAFKFTKCNRFRTILQANLMDLERDLIKHVEDKSVWNYLVEFL